MNKIVLFFLALALALHSPNIVYAPIIDSMHPIHEFSLQPSRSADVLVFEATAYTWTGRKTVTGTWPVEGRTVAVDPAIIPLNSHLIINGVGGYIAEDSGGDIKGNRLDIYMDSEGACWSYGRRPVEVVILDQ